jgi:undecaprenyl-diphosphatase
MLSKYTMGIFLPSLFFCMLHAQQFRSRFFGFGPWVGLLLSLLLFSPVLIWNYQNEWATFRHVMHQGGVDREQLFTLQFVGDFLLTQVALLSPFIFFLITIGWCGGGRTIRRIDRLFLTWMSLPTFLLFLLFSLRTRVYGNWPAAGYITALILVTVLFAPTISNNIRTARFFKFAVLFAYLLTIPVLIQIVRPVIPIPVELDRASKETRGWDVLADAVQTELDAMPKNRRGKPFAFGLTYQYASELAFYMKGQPQTISINRWTRPNVYDFWQEEGELLGKDAVGVYEWEGMEVYLKEVFERVEVGEKCVIYRDSPWLGREELATHFIVRAYGFKGGLRWKPPNTKDIRATNLQTDHS